MDEKEGVLGSGERVRVAIRRAHRRADRQRTVRGNRDYATVVEGVSTTGFLGPSLVIFKGKEMSVE